MKYKLICGDGFCFEQEVNEAMEQGWRPLGGVAVIRYEYETRKGYLEAVERFFQAMTLEEASE